MLIANSNVTQLNGEKLSLSAQNFMSVKKMFSSPISLPRAVRPLNYPSPLISSIMKPLNHYQINLQHLQYRRSESGDMRQETGDRRWETEDGRQEIGDRRLETED